MDIFAFYIKAKDFLFCITLFNGYLLTLKGDKNLQLIEKSWNKTLDSRLGLHF